MKLLLIAAGLHSALLTVAIAQDTKLAEIEIAGTVIKAGKITLDEINALPAPEQDVQFQTSKGSEKGHYKGPLLMAACLRSCGIKDLPGHNAQLMHTFIVEGRDGYRIAFSVGEIDPDFGNAPMLIATEKDGVAITQSEGYRLVKVPATSGAHVMS